MKITTVMVEMTFQNLLIEYIKDYKNKKYNYATTKTKIIRK